MAQDSIERLRQFRDDIHVKNSLALSQISLYETLDDELVDYHLGEISTLRTNTQRLGVGWQSEKGREEEFRFWRAVVLPYVLSFCDSLEATVERVRGGRFLDAKARYELALKADCLSPGDVVDVEKDYHEAADKFFETQKLLKKNGFLVT